MEEKKNEQEISIFNNVQTAGVIAVVSICLFFIIVSAVVSRGFVGYDYIAIIFVYLSVVCFYSFSKFKNIYHLIIGFGFLLVFICMVALYFINI